MLIDFKTALFACLLIVIGSHASASNIIRAFEDAGVREDGSGAFRTHCLESHVRNDDPLLAPKRAGASHRHVFFGNTTVDSTTNFKSLKKALATKCDGNVLNRSGYWVPALYGNSGQRMKFVDPLFYYKTGYHVPAASIVPPPVGLAIVAGNMHAQKPQNPNIIKFRCESWTSDETWFDPGDPLDHVSLLPDCDMGDILEIRIVFPQCWDGKNLGSGGYQNHMAYPSRATLPRVGTGRSPKSHPIAIPEISYNFAIYVTEETGPSKDWRFSSDPERRGLGGLTLHADWMNGWDQDVMETIVKQCLRPAKECMVGLLGNGTRLKPVELD